MVYGNLGSDCATGVCFTRDPSTGEPGVFGEYLINAQGEDVVAGIRNPAPLNNFSKNETNKSQKTLEESMPEAYKELTEICSKLEGGYLDMTRTLNSPLRIMPFIFSKLGRQKGRQKLL